MEGIFISHSTRDDTTARLLADKLRQKGKRVWIDGEGLKVGDILPEQIREALARCEIFILLWSQNARDSGWVKLE